MTQYPIFEEHPVFRHFHAINQIPRPSGQEKAVSDWLVQWGKQRGLKTEQDAVNNVRIVRPASPGFESAPRLIVQGHMDMVCVKTADSDHDFSKDPIEMEISEGWVHAKDTTLGADDAIGVAMGLALLDETFPMPEIELLITTDEEEGMNGAMGLSSDWLNAQMLINIDSEEEGFVTSGCAGGLTGNFTLPIAREDVKTQSAFHLQIRGMRGGHSGMNILIVPNNAVKLMSEWLTSVQQKLPFALHDLSAGSKHNAIPNEADAWISFDVPKEEVLPVLQSTWNTILEKVLKQEPDIEASIVEEATELQPLTSKSKIAALSLIDIMPHGVYRMNADGQTVQASDNLAIVRLEPEQMRLMVSIRSSKYDTMDALKGEVERAVATFGGTGFYEDPYPAWEFEEESPLRDLFSSIYREETGKDIEILDIHAGLECGLFAKQKPDLDMISIGPDILGAHTVQERLSVDSTVRTYALLQKLVESIAKQGAKRV